MSLEKQAGHEGPVGQANALGAAPMGSRTTETFQTGKQHDWMAVCRRKILERAGGHGGVEGDSQAVGGRLVESSDC